MSFEPHPTVRPALITGGSSGIGAATAMAFAALGHPVAITGRRVDRLEQVAKSITDAGGTAVPIRMDLRDPDEVAAGVAAAQRAIGDIEILISNAGDNEPAPVHDTDRERFADHFATNVLAPQQLTALVGGQMIERRRGDIVYVSSMNASVPRVQSGAYNASKAALENYVRTAQMEFEGTGVRASILRPGPTLTEMGWGWEQSKLDFTMREWMRWGVLRHGGFVEANAMAEAIVTIATAPRGMVWTLAEINPEAPIEPRTGN